jgi:hypothetical protein
VHIKVVKDCDPGLSQHKGSPDLHPHCIAVGHVRELISLLCGGKEGCATKRTNMTFS